MTSQANAWGHPAIGSHGTRRPSQEEDRLLGCSNEEGRAPSTSAQGNTSLAGEGHLLPW